MDHNKPISKTFFACLPFFVKTIFADGVNAFWASIKPLRPNFPKINGLIPFPVFLSEIWFNAWDISFKGFMQNIEFKDYLNVMFTE